MAPDPKQVIGTKRKGAPSSSANSQPSQSHGSTRQQTQAQARKRQRTFEARTIASQTTSQAYHGPSSSSKGTGNASSTPSGKPNAPPADAGQLNVDKFVRAREFEIRALESGLKRASAGLNSRAFQGVPKDLRRRTASHDVRRIPKRLQARARAEMVQDNTPGLEKRRAAKRRERKAKGWLKAGTRDVVRRLFGSKKKKKDTGNEDGSDAATVAKDATHKTKKKKKPKNDDSANAMRQAPILKPKFRKRQINKAWLPTHIYHAKRAHMTPPSEPLWRMAIPLSPTAKTYRPTHRAGTVRGAIAWDMSYMSTIGLSGPEGSIRNLLASIGVPWAEESTSTGPKASRWLTGTRSWNGWLHEHGTVPKAYIAPATIFWCVHEASDTTKTTDTRRQVMVRIHPSAFFQLWAETLRLSKLQRPVVFVEDLRYEIGSIELAGPAAAEAMIGTLWPSLQDSLHEPDSPSQVLSRLGNVTDASALPAGAMISTETSDPRLHHPPRSKKLNKTETLEAQQSLARLLTEWHVDRTQGPAALFSRQARHDAGHRLPTQKAINRRKSLAPPGEYPAAVEGDPKIPTLVLASRRAAGGTSTGTWTILLPWKCVLPVWYSLMYQPLSTGGNPRLGGLDQRRQLHFESGTPWFPGDYPATPAGAAWNARESTKRHEAWSRRPKGKRIEYESLDLGRGRKGEVGAGWSCEWGLLCGGSEGQSKSDKPVWHIPMHEALQAMRDTGTNSRTEGQQQGDASGLVTVKLTLLTRGVPTTCARVYRLPKTDAKLRAEWLSLLSLSKEKARHKATAVVPPLSRDAPVHERRRQLAASLLEPPAMPQAGDDGYPDTPDPDELLGFVTGGNFNLGEGRGTAIGSLALQRILEQEKHGLGEHERICIVRNVGQSIGRLARWDLV